MYSRYVDRCAKDVNTCKFRENICIGIPDQYSIIHLETQDVSHVY